MEIDDVGQDHPNSQNRMPSLKPQVALEQWRRERTLNNPNVSLRKPKMDYNPKQTQTHNSSDIAFQAKESTMLTDIKEWISSPSPVIQLQGIKIARNLLCQSTEMKELHSNNSALINLNIIPDCIKILTTDNFKLVAETTWLLSNISAGNAFHTNSLVNAGVIPRIIFLLKSSEAEIVEHSVRTLGNCMAENEEIRMKILNMRVIPALVDVIKRYRDNIVNMRTLAFTLLHASKVNSPMSAVAPQEKFGIMPYVHSSVVSTSNRSIFQTEQILIAVHTLILLKDTDVLSSVCWIAFHITSNGVDGVDSVLRAGLLPKLLFLLSKNDEEVILPCLKAIGNIAAVTTQIDQLIKYGIITSLVPFLKSSNLDCVYEAIWILSGIAEGTENHIKEILESCVFEEIASLIRSEICSMHIKKECLFIIKSLAATSEEYNVNKVMEKIHVNRIMEIIVPCLMVKDTAVIEISLRAMQNILKLYAKNKGKFRFVISHFDGKEGVDELENLAYHLNHSISQTSCEIMEKYFPDGRSEYFSSCSDHSFSDLDSSDENGCEVSEVCEEGLFL